MKLALPVKEAFLKRCDAYWEHRQKPGCEPWKTVEALEKRISEMAEMLNHHHKDAGFRVENERDACARAIQSLLDEVREDYPEEKRAIAELEQAVRTIEARRDPTIQFLQEMVNGTVLGEFVQRAVEDALKEKDGG